MKGQTCTCLKCRTAWMFHCPTVAPLSRSSISEGWVAHYAQVSVLLQHGLGYPNTEGDVISWSKGPLLALEETAYSRIEWRSSIMLVFQLGLAFSSGNSRASAHLNKRSYWNMVSFSEFWTLNPSGRHQQTVVALMIDSSNLTVLPQEPSELLKSDFSYIDHHFDWGKCPKRFCFWGKKYQCLSCLDKNSFPI